MCARDGFKREMVLSGSTILIRQGSAQERRPACWPMVRGTCSVTGDRCLKVRLPLATLVKRSRQRCQVIPGAVSGVGRPHTGQSQASWTGVLRLNWSRGRFWSASAPGMNPEKRLPRKARVLAQDRL
jgi:hypothetical protein